MTDWTVELILTIRQTGEDANSDEKTREGNETINFLSPVRGEKLENHFANKLPFMLRYRGKERTPLQIGKGIETVSFSIFHPNSLFSNLPFATTSPDFRAPRLPSTTYFLSFSLLIPSLIIIISLTLSFPPLNPLHSHLTSFKFVSPNILSPSFKNGTTCDDPLPPTPFPRIEVGGKGGGLGDRAIERKDKMVSSSSNNSKGTDRVLLDLIILPTLAPSSSKRGVFVPRVFVLEGLGTGFKTLSKAIFE